MIEESPFHEQGLADTQKKAVAAGATIALMSVATYVYKQISKKSRARRIDSIDEELAACAKNIELQSRYFEDWFAADYFVLDSNVWMDPDSDELFDVLFEEALEYRGRIACFQSQISEIDRCKIAKLGHGLGKDERKAWCAGLANKRIERFRVAGLTRFLEDQMVAKRNMHVDEIIVAYFMKTAPLSTTVRIVSDDRGLRNRCMKLEEAKRGLYRTLTMQEVKARAKELADLRRTRTALERELSVLRAR